MPINIDATEDSQDWIKGRYWDFPEDADAFLALVRPQRLEAFMRRRSAKAMPPALKTELIRRGLING